MRTMYVIIVIDLLELNPIQWGVAVITPFGRQDMYSNGSEQTGPEVLMRKKSIVRRISNNKLHAYMMLQCSLGSKSRCLRLAKNCVRLELRLC